MVADSVTYTNDDDDGLSLLFLFLVPVQGRREPPTNLLHLHEARRRTAQPHADVQLRNDQVEVLPGETPPESARGPSSSK